MVSARACLLLLVRMVTGKLIAIASLGRRARAGLVLSALAVLSTLPTSLLIALPPPLKMTLNDTLDALARALQRRREPNSVIFALLGLTAVDPALWTSKGEEEGECELWGEKTWRGIMGGVEDADEGARRAVSWPPSESEHGGRQVEPTALRVRRLSAYSFAWILPSWSCT